jgi:hypothetical protein
MLSFAYNKTWIDVFDELTSIARENFDVLNSKDVYVKYLELPVAGSTSRIHLWYHLANRHHDVEAVAGFTVP